MVMIGYITLQEVFQCLLRSFHAAHSLILQEEAQLTTLTAVVVLPVSDREGKVCSRKILNKTFSNVRM